MTVYKAQREGQKSNEGSWEIKALCQILSETVIMSNATIKVLCFNRKSTSGVILAMPLEHLSEKIWGDDKTTCRGFFLFSTSINTTTEALR